MPERLPCPEPGVYEGIPAETYHRWGAASNSALNKLAGRSPMHARYELDNPRPRTDAMTVGDALHLSVLEPHLIAERYVVTGPCAVPLKSGDRKGEPCGAPGKVLAAGEWACGKHANGEAADARIPLSADDHAACLAMRDRVLADPDAGGLLAVTEQRELSIVFDWPGLEVRCKARIDIPAFDALTIGDLKKCQDASFEGFSRSVQKYGYYRQAPFYLTGCGVLAAMGLLPVAPEHFLFVAVEECAPHGLGVYRIGDREVVKGRAELDQLLRVWKWCTEHDDWPGYPSGVRDIHLPEWAFKG